MGEKFSAASSYTIYGFSSKFSLSTSSKEGSSTSDSGREGLGEKETWRFWALDSDRLIKAVGCLIDSDIVAEKSTLIR